MPEENDRLEAFTATILKNASDEAQAILAEVEEERKKALSTAEDEILNEIYGYVRTETSRIRAEVGRKVSRKLLDNKKELFAYREQMRQRVLDDVRDKINEYVGSTEYPGRLKSMLSEAVLLFRGEKQINVLLNERDLTLAGELKKLGGDKELVFAASADITLGGLVCECPERRLRVDKSFDTSMLGVSDRFAELIGLEGSGK